jgi:2-keto-3-deoxy-L-rhamnonate aldolase RhmA
MPAGLRRVTIRGEPAGQGLWAPAWGLSCRALARGMIAAGRTVWAVLPALDQGDLLQAIAPVAGLGRVVCGAPDVAIALGHDTAAALEDADDY